MIPVFKPSYGQEELNALKEVFESGWLGLGPKTKEFEDKFANFIGTKFASGLNSGTAALHLALKVAEVEGGEVITTPMTFVSTNHAILYNNAHPVFADIEADTLNISVDEIAKLITNKTKAILVVHYGGHPCDMDPILELAKKHNLRVIEDCAHACGSKYKGKRVGGLGDAGCFSFHAVKNLACGEGGMVTFNHEAWQPRLTQLRWLGINKGTWDRTEKGKFYHWEYQVNEVGFKAHLSDIPSALGLVQLKKLEEMNNARRRVVARYNEAFSKLGWIECPVEKDYAFSASHNYVIKIEGRDDFVTYMATKEISTGVHYYPNHLYSVYERYYRKLPIAEEVSKKIVTLPIYPDLTVEQIDYIIETVRNYRA